jgi:hypothetical protein
VNTDVTDSFISAQIPDPVADPSGYEWASEFMTHVMVHVED